MFTVSLTYQGQRGTVRVDLDTHAGPSAGGVETMHKTVEAAWKQLVAAIEAQGS